VPTVATINRASALPSGAVLYDVSGKRIRVVASPGVYFTEEGGRVRRLTLVR
jgi:hypothetical protein